jgi:hypothetical protein
MATRALAGLAAAEAGVKLRLALRAASRAGVGFQLVVPTPDVSNPSIQP